MALWVLLTTTAHSSATCRRCYSSVPQMWCHGGSGPPVVYGTRDFLALGAAMCLTVSFPIQMATGRPSWHRGAIQRMKNRSELTTRFASFGWVSFSRWKTAVGALMFLISFKRRRLTSLWNQWMSDSKDTYPLKAFFYNRCYEISLLRISTSKRLKRTAALVFNVNLHKAWVEMLLLETLKERNVGFLFCKYPWNRVKTCETWQYE